MHATEHLGYATGTHTPGRSPPHVPSALGSATHPLEGSRQEAKRPPCTTLANFFAVALCSAYSTPRRVAADASLFSRFWCRPRGAAPHTHQAQGRDGWLKSQPSAPGTLCAPENRRCPAASNRVPRTDHVVPSRVQFQHGSRQRRHPHPSSGPVASQLAEGEAGTNQVIWLYTTVALSLQPHPPYELGLSQKLW